MTTPAELLRAFNAMDSSRKAKPLWLVEDEERQEEEPEQDTAESS